MGVALGAVVTVVTTIAFTAWVNLDNAINYPADETGQAAIYPANHGLYGVALGLSLAAAVALTAATAWLALARSQPSPGRTALIVVFAMSLGVSCPVSIQHSVMLASPLLALSIAAAVIAIATGRQRHQSAP